MPRVSSGSFSRHCGFCFVGYYPVVYTVYLNTAAETPSECYFWGGVGSASLRLFSPLVSLKLSVSFFNEHVSFLIAEKQMLV